MLAMNSSTISLPMAVCKSRKLVKISTKSFRASSRRRREIEEGVVNDLVNSVLGVNKENV